LAWLLDRTSVSWVDKVSKWIGLLPEDAETERDGWQEIGAYRVELEKDVFDYTVSHFRLVWDCEPDSLTYGV
jgi:hypothetical protein